MIRISLKELFIVILMAFIFVFLIGFPFKVTSTEVIMALVSLYYFLFLWYFLNKNNVSFYNFLNFGDFNFKVFIKKTGLYVIKYVLTIVGFSIFISSILFLIKYIDPVFFDNIMSDVCESNDVSFFENVHFPVLKILNLLLLVPFFEEIIFRRFLFYSLREKNNFWKSAIISSLFFTIFHIDKLLLIFIASLYLSYVFEKEKNIVMNVVVHSSINFVYLLTYLL